MKEEEEEKRDGGSSAEYVFYDLCSVEVLFYFLILPLRKTECLACSHGSMKEEKEKRDGGFSAEYVFL
jgi:hypothetical protein